MTRRRKAPAPAPCAPTGPLTRIPLPDTACTCGAPYRCDCGQPMRRTWNEDGTDTRHVDPQDRTWHPVDRPSWDELAAADIAAYSAISAAVALGMEWTTHTHRVIPCQAPDHPVQPCPECCGQPMRLLRDGWSCRVAGTFTPFMEAAA